MNGTTAGLDALGARGIVVHESAVARAADQAAAGASARRGGLPAGLHGLARRLAQRAAATGPGRRVLKVVLRDPETLRWALLHLSDRQTRDRRVGDAVAGAPARIEGFEDCAWLFSSNALNHGVSRLDLAEAAHLFRLVRGLGRPRIVEIGRFQGGTTLLLAAAGADVLSVDLDLPMQAEVAPPLAEALERLGLRERVELVVADSRVLPPPPEPVDVIFFDGDHTRAGVLADVAHWWPALRPGGHAVFHDATREYPWVEGVADALEEVRRRPDVREVPGAGSIAHLIKA